MPTARRREDFVLRVLVCADRELVARLREALFAVGDVELVGSARNAAEVLAQSSQAQPDLILLDTDRLGSEAERLLAALREQPEPVTVVAVTTSPERAPAGVRTLRPPPGAEAIRRLLAAVRADARSEVAAARPGAEGAAGLQAAGLYVRRLLVRSPGHVRLLPVEDIYWIDAIHNAVKLHASQGDFRLRQSIAALMTQLDPSRFVRIHRSTAVQLDAVREFRVNARGQYSAAMPGGAKLTVSRSYHEALLARLRQS